MSQPLDPAAAVRYGEFVIDAYAMYQGNQSSLTPAPIVPAGWALVAWIQMSDFVLFNSTPKFYGYIARNANSPDQHLIVIRGTVGWVEWIDDCSILKVPFAQAPGAGRVAYGFDKIYSTMNVVPKTSTLAKTLAVSPSQTLTGSFGEQVDQLVAARPRSAALPPDAVEPPPSLVVTGHSLGAALCTLYVMEHAAKKQAGAPTICTFASPRVGDSVFVAAFNALALTSWRIVNVQDLVPGLPPPLLGYAHVDCETAKDSNGLVQWTPTCWHVMETYLALLDGSLKPGSDCALSAQDLASVRSQ
ncbi:MAG TPA: lipase family protein [Candidatus Eremiobacteraceae bacterium]|nr:lipase family protein [Candidatus Eremiobacteraceae bacterium]